MIIKRPKQLENYYSDRYKIIKSREIASVELKSYSHHNQQLPKRRSSTILDSKKLRSRLSQILKDEDQLKRTQSAIIQATRDNKQKFKQYFHRTFLKKKEKKDDSRFHHLIKQKMEIIGDDQAKEDIQSLFNIKQLKIRRKGSPLILPSEKQCLQQVYLDRECKVLSFAKTRFNSEKFHKKPPVPELFKISNPKKIPNNFLRGRNITKLNQEQLGIQKLEPWEKQQQFQAIQYDI